MEECLMIIKDILDLTQTKTIAEIAKESLNIGEKPAREAMREAGCYSIVGKPGWFFEEDADPENLEESIYVFADQVKMQKEATLKAITNQGSNEGWSESQMIPRKRHSFDLDVRLVKQLKVHCVKRDKTLYEVVEKAIQEYLERENNEGTKAL